jgi:predicted PolB exonuclease-like 3'-5' exonuclease
MGEQDKYFKDPGIERGLANAAKQIAEKNMRRMQPIDDPEPVQPAEPVKEEKPAMSAEERKGFVSLLDGPPVRSKFIIWDIETAARDLPEEFEKYLIEDCASDLVQKAAIEKRKANFLSEKALSPMTGKIILSGIIDQDKKVVQYGLDDGLNERTLVENTFEYIANNYDMAGVLITMNGKEFDLPFLISRALQLNCETTLKVPKSLIGKYAKQHIDFRDIFKGSLAKMSYLCGVDENFRSEGSLIPQWYEAGEYGKIKAKNMMDLYNSFNLYRKIERLINIWA